MRQRVETTIRNHLQANDAVQETIEWAEIVARPDDVTVEAAPYRSRRSRVWVVVAVAVVTVVLIGVVPALMGNQTQTADTVVATTVANSVVPTSVPTPQLSVYEIPLTVIAETVRPSSVGDSYWTVYEGAWTEALDAQFGGGSQEGDPSQIQPLFSGDGIVTRASADSLGTAGGVTLTYWFVWVDWVETTLAYLGGDLRERSDDGDLLATFPYEEGVFEIVLFETREDACCYDTGQRDFLLGETVARFALTSIEEQGRWRVRVIDADSGDPVGSIASSVPLDGRTAGSLFTLSQADDIEIVYPEWADRAYAAGYNVFNGASMVVDGAFLVYVEQFSGDSFAGYEIWRSYDGSAWENLGPPSGWPDAHRADEIVQREGVHMTMALIDDSQQGQASIALRSEDGITWSAIEGLPRRDGNIHTVDAGWVWTSSETGISQRVWTSPDGVLWDKVDTTDIPGLLQAGDRAALSSQWSSDNTIFMLHWVGSPSQARLWVVQFP